MGAASEAGQSISYQLRELAHELEQLQRLASRFHTRPAYLIRCALLLHLRERVLFIGTQFSNHYTAGGTPTRATAEPRDGLIQIRCALLLQLLLHLRNQITKGCSVALEVNHFMRM